MDAFELLGENMQIGISDPQRLELFYGRQYIVATGTRAAVSLTGVMQLLGEAQSSGILPMAAVDHVAKSVDTFLRVVVEPNPAPCLAIDRCDLFASTQIFDRFGPA